MLNVGVSILLLSEISLQVSKLHVTAVKSASAAERSQRAVSHNEANTERSYTKWPIICGQPFKLGFTAGFCGGGIFSRAVFRGLG